ncbi:MAG: hypothetical protein M1838_000777 [Thelocarpon superellum]|nr:MAG: hypothetical protein M1838_000777 [Thelocarpon superellum]
MILHLCLIIVCVLLLCLRQSLTETCKCGPRDACWPDKQAWDELSQDVGGRLIPTVPIGHVCHSPTYNATACVQLQQAWDLSDTHETSSSSVMQRWWANFSCNPFDPPSKPCRIGDYVRYAIDVATEDHIIKGIQFAQRHNIRLVIRNTGHDFLGRSTGYGSLALWMHHVTGPQFIANYTSPQYRGPAVKVMAGDQVDDLLAYLQRQGHVAVAGTCPSVGMAGGYTSGGGHGTLISLFGLSADNTLEFEVITAAGEKITASPNQNQDLYWALSGGGPGNYAVVWSMTLKVFPDFPVANAILSFDIGNHTEDTFWRVIDTWHTLVPAINDAGAYAYAYYQQGHFQLFPLLAFNMSTIQAADMLAPLRQQLERLGFQYNFTTQAFPNYITAYHASFPEWFVGTFTVASRLIPLDVVQHNASGLSSTVRGIFDDGALIIEQVMAPTLRAAGHPDNAVLPAWRSTSIDLVVGSPWNDTAPVAEDVAQQKLFTDTWMPALQALTPSSGVYMNEGDPNDPEWQSNFFGVNYGRLAAIKRKWDPTSFFYARQAVGSEAWAENDEQVLCRTAG